MAMYVKYSYTISNILNIPLEYKVLFAYYLLELRYSEQNADLYQHF